MMFYHAWLSLVRTVMQFQFEALNPEYEDLNLILAREYVRRAALWAQALNCRDQWPFFDATRRIDPTFEMTTIAEEMLHTRLQETLGSGRMMLLMKAAFRWYAHERPTHAYLPDLYAPIIAMYLHHGQITAEHHLIQTPILGFAKQPFEAYLLHAPYIDAEAVNALMTPPPPPPVTKFTFAKAWFRAHKRATALWDIETAQSAHAAKQPYTVLAGEKVDHPFAFLEIGPMTGFIGVNFLDSQLRAYLEYQFKQSDERYFLNSIVYRVYDGNSETVVLTETYRFTPEGELTIYENNLLDQITTTRTALNRVDVSRNWEDAPIFGQYAGFVRVER